MKDIVILIALVKYPSSNNTYPTANSFLVETHDVETLDKLVGNFKSLIETDGFRIINFLVYIVPRKQIVDANG